MSNISYKTHIKDICYNIKNSKPYYTIDTPHFKKKIKIFTKKDTMFINPNIKHFFKYCSVKDWLIFSQKLETMLLTDDFKIQYDKIISSLILSFISPDFHYLLPSYYHYSSRRIPKIKRKYHDIEFLIKSLIHNNDQDNKHLNSLKYKLRHLNISNFKFVFHDHLTPIKSRKTILKENITDITKDALINHININKKRKKTKKIYKIRKDFIYDGFLLFFLNLNNFELKNVLFYKNDLRSYDYEYEIFVIKKIT